MSSAREASPWDSRSAAEWTRLMSRSTNAWKAAYEPLCAYSVSNRLSVFIVPHRLMCAEYQDRTNLSEQRKILRALDVVGKRMGRDSGCLPQQQNRGSSVLSLI